MSDALGDGGADRACERNHACAKGLFDLCVLASLGFRAAAGRRWLGAVARRCLGVQACNNAGKNTGSSCSNQHLYVLLGAADLLFVVGIAGAFFEGRTVCTRHGLCLRVGERIHEAMSCVGVDVAHSSEELHRIDAALQGKVCKGSC